MQKPKWRFKRHRRSGQKLGRIPIGVLGQKNKHIILAQNNFRCADGLYDIDYTAIPVGWTEKLQ